MLSSRTLLGVVMLSGLVACVHGDESAKEEAARFTNQADQHRYAENGQQDYSEAVRLYSKAAELGDAYAQCSLGFLHLNGQGVEKSESKAKQYFELAAKSREPDALLQLGRIELASKNTRSAIGYFKASMEETKKEGNGKLLANRYRNIVALLTVHDALDETADYLPPLCRIQSNLSKPDRLEIADLYFNVGAAYSRRSDDKQREPEVRADLESAQAHLEVALRLYRECLGGDVNVQVARTLDAIGSANVKRSGVSWIHLPTYRMYKYGGIKQLEEAYRIYCDVLGSDHETSKELRQFIDGMPHPIMSDGRP